MVRPYRGRGLALDSMWGRYLDSTLAPEKDQEMGLVMVPQMGPWKVPERVQLMVSVRGRSMDLVMGHQKVLVTAQLRDPYLAQHWVRQTDLEKGRA